VAKIKVRQTGSTIDRPKSQKRVMESLGLSRIGKVREHNDTPQIRGMIFKVKHLVKVTQ
jgi:large subunit ribosomal protein L30